jgi:metallo-beta-lactamase family protein
MLVHGAKTVKIFGDVLNVRATVVNPSGYSAHADQSELLRWLNTLETKPHLYAVHGEPASAAALALVVQQKLGFSASVAARGTTVTL